MAESANEKVTKGKIEFLRNNVTGRTPLWTIFKGTFEGKIAVAVKRISLNLARLGENEIDVLLVKRNHANVVKYYYKKQDLDFCYIAMQLCPCNLEEYVEKRGNYSPSLPSTPVEEILRGTAEGLSQIHKRDIIHRDIKPSSILLFVKGKKLVPKISDFGVSRIMQDHHAVSDYFSAGTDLYKAPELLAPSFSWRSDVYAFGLVVLYVLSKGKHLVDKNPSQIIKCNPVNLKDLNGQPAALSLIKWLTAFNQEERPRMTEVVHHPFFWDDERKLNFIRDVHQRTEDKQNASLKEVIEEDSHHVICSSPRKCGNQRTPPNRDACADWTSFLTPLVKADLPRTVNIESCAELICIIRNKLTHFYDLKEAVKAEYGGNIEGFRRYWLHRFPSLVIHLWEKVEITHLAALFRGYYAPGSVRRTNEETTLLRTIDEGKLGDPKELSNKVKKLGTKIWNMALDSAVVKGRKEDVEVLLENDTGPNVENKDDVITNLLRDATRNGFADVAKLLIERGAVVNYQDKYGDTPLHEAASNGHSEVAKLLIERGAVVNYQDKYEDTPLHAAASKGHLEVAKLLIERGAEVNCKNMFGKTPLHEAASNGHSEAAQLLIERGAEVNCKDVCVTTPLHLAASDGHSEIAKLLIESGIQPNSEQDFGKTPLHEAASKVHSEVAKLLIERGAQLNSKQDFGKTPLHLAASEGHLEVTKLLIERGAEVKIERTKQFLCYVLKLVKMFQVVFVVTLVMLSSTVAGNEQFCSDSLLTSPKCQILTERVEHLEKSWRMKYEQLEKQFSALEEDSEANFETLQKTLLTRIIDLEQQLTETQKTSEGRLGKLEHQLTEAQAKLDTFQSFANIQYLQAAETGGMAALDLIHSWIERELNLNEARTADRGYSALHVAVKFAHGQIVDSLINAGADLEVRDKDGCTPLHLAAAHGHNELVELLVISGASIEAKCNNGTTPLHYAASNGHTEVVQFLIHASANVEAKDDEGWTPLHSAANSNQGTVIAVLVKAGANKEARSNNGRTPLHVAAYGGKDAAFRELRRFRADTSALDDDNKTPAQLATENGHVNLLFIELF